MTDKSDSISPEEAAADKGFAFARSPSSFQDPATVVTKPGQSLQPVAETPPVSEGSSVLRRLFPPNQTDDSRSNFASPEGCQLEHFVVEKRIGVGGMGSVFLAFDQRLKRTVALKVLSPGPSNDSAAVLRFQNEAQSAARLDHDNIARVYYIGFDKGLHFIAYEYVTGTNIRDIIQNSGQLPPIEAVNYTLQIATALRHTWAAGVVHRDIKPSNVIITPRGRAKIVDLGLARKENSESVGELTVAGTTLGTFDYISPEQAKDPRRVDVRSDIYSLGCTLYHMLAGTPPYPEGTVLQKLLDHQGKNIPDVRTKNPLVSPELSAVVLKMMASDPNDRYAHPDDLIRDLLMVARSLGLPANTPEGLVWASRWLQKPRFWERNGVWIASVVTLLIIVFLVDQYPNGKSSQNTASATVDGLGESSSSRPDLVDPIPTEDPAPDNPGKVPDPDAFPGPNELAKLSDPSISIPGAVGASNDPLKQFEPATEPSDTPDGTFLPDNENQPTADETGVAKMSKPDPKNAGGSSKPELGSAPKIKTGPTPATTTLPEQQISIVGSSQTFPSLAAAIAAADEKTGSIVELKYDGPLTSRNEKPIKFTDKKITIRAGKKNDGTHFHPVIRLGDNTDADHNSMISLKDASLKLYNVDVLMVAPLYLSDGKEAQLFSLTGSDELELRGCSVTVQNPGETNTTIIHSDKSDLTRMSKMGATGPENLTQIRIDITRSIIRGDNCNLFTTRHTHPIRFKATNSVIAVDGSVLNVLGDRDTLTDDSLLEFDLQQVTCFCGNGLVHIDAGEANREIPPLSISSHDNILVTDTTSPLVTSAGKDSSEIFRWTGETNFYVGFEKFWYTTVDEPVKFTETLSFEGWKTKWNESEVAAKNSGLIWSSDSWKNKQTSTLIASDFSIDPSPQNIAVGAASDGSDVGAEIDLLPIAPDFEVTESE